MLLKSDAPGIVSPGSCVRSTRPDPPSPLWTMISESDASATTIVSAIGSLGYFSRAWPVSESFTEKALPVRARCPGFGLSNAWSYGSYRSSSSSGSGRQSLGGAEGWRGPIRIGCNCGRSTQGCGCAVVQVIGALSQSSPVC